MRVQLAGLPFLEPVGDKFLMAVNIDLAQGGVTDVHEAMRRACWDRDDVSRGDFPLFVANRA